VALGLVAYGVIGIGLAVASLLALAGPIAALDALAGRRADAVRWLDLAAAGLADAERSGDAAVEALRAAESSARSAAGLFRELSATMAGLRDASAISILGAQPLGGLTDDLDRVAGRSATLADEMGGLTGSLAAGHVSLDRLAQDAGRLQAELAGLRSVVLSSDGAGWPARPGGQVGLVVLLVAWLVLPAVASLVVGIDRLRRLSRPPRSSRAEIAGAW
jgi:hypothetical protein